MKHKDIIFGLIIMGGLVISIELGYGLLYMIGMMAFGFYRHRHWLSSYGKNWVEQFKIIWNYKKE